LKKEIGCKSETVTIFHWAYSEALNNTGISKEDWNGWMATSCVT